MTKSLLRVIHFDPGMCPDKAYQSWDSVMEDVDELFRWLGTGSLMRRIVELRLCGLTYEQIAQQTGRATHEVRRLLRRAGEELCMVGAIARPEKASKAAKPEAKRYRAAPLDKRATVWPDIPVRRHRPSPTSLKTLAGANSRPIKEPHSMPLFKSDHATPDARITGRTLTPLESFGWRDVYYSEVHRWQRK